MLFVQTLWGQSALRLQHLNVEDGLSQSSVNYIFQDRQGFMWFATGDGLDRYDGKEFVIYKSRFGDSLTSQMRDRNINSHIFEDRTHKFWLSTDAGLSFMNSRNGTFGSTMDKYAVPYDAILLAVDSQFVWAAVPQYGMYSIDINSLQKTFYPFTDTLQNKKSVIYPITNAVLTGSGLWVADRAGLLFFDKKLHTDKRLIVNEQLTGVHMLRNGRLLLTSSDCIYLYDTLTGRTELIPIKSNNGTPFLWRSAAEDYKSGNIYLGAFNSGIICKINLADRKPEFITFQNYIITCMFIDRSQNLWVGTDGNGAYKLDIKQPKFACFTPDFSTGDNDAEGCMINSIYKDDSGKIWLGTYDHGLAVYDPAKRTCKNIPVPFSVAKKHISTILRDSTGDLIVTIGNSILWLNPLNGKVIKQLNLPLDVALSPEEPVIYSLIEWKKGHYLAGSNLSLYSIFYEKGKLVNARPYIQYTDLFLSSHTYSLYKDTGNVIYVGKRKGFSKIEMVSDTSIRVLDEGFGQVATRHFYKCASKPILWMASEKGLIAYNETTKRYQSFDEGDGLKNSYVYAILARNDSSLWVSTNQGISQVKVQYGNMQDIKARFVNYTVKDGLQSNEFNTGAYHQSKDGTFFFGGIKGINWFNPTKIESNLYPAIPAIAQISVNNQLFARDSAPYVQTITLPYDRNTVSLSLSALEYTRPEQNAFSYKLEGMDKEWTTTTNDNVRYPNLPPGTYTFLLKASNNEGIWNDEPLRLKIIILPPFYQTWWFRILIAVLISSIIFVSVRIYIHQKIRAKTRELEKQQALYMERLRISKDVHDDLGSGLSKISLMAELAQKKTTGDAPLGNDMKLISNVSKELVDNMHDLIWVLNPENTTLEQLVSRLREYCSDFLENIPIDVVMRFPDDVPAMKISRDAQRNIFLTTKEAINNCIKHAGASEIKIELSLDHGAFSIAVTDNGKGFDMAHLKGSGNGLRNMRQRIEQVGGRFNIVSVPGKTSITISITFENLCTEKNTTFM